MDAPLAVPHSVLVLTLASADVRQDPSGVTVLGDPVTRYEGMGITEIVCGAAQVTGAAAMEFARVTHVVVMRRDAGGNITFIDPVGQMRTIGLYNRDPKRMTAQPLPLPRIRIVSP